MGLYGHKYGQYWCLCEEQKNVDSLQKQIGKYCVNTKVMAKTKYFVKKGPKIADFLCILGRNLKLMATGLGWWENS